MIQKTKCRHAGATLLVALSTTLAAFAGPLTDVVDLEDPGPLDPNAITLGDPKSGGGGNLDTGNDPSQFANKLFTYYRHTKLKNGVEINDWSGLFFLAGNFMGWETAFIWESPIIREIDVPGVGSETGVADWVMRLGFQVPNQTDLGGGLKASHVFLPEFTLPTGSGLLSGDTTIVSPGYVPVISKGTNWFFAPAFFYDFDVDKGTRGTDVNRARSRIFYQYVFSTKPPMYFFPEVQMAYDFETDHFSSWIAPEIGMFFMKPDCGVTRYNVEVITN